MAVDIAPELLEKITKRFNELFENDKAIQSLYEAIKNGTATYYDANEFAIKVGGLMSKSFREFIDVNSLPDGKFYYNIAKRIFEPMLSTDHDLVADYCVEVQKLLNQSAKIGMNPIKPAINDDRVRGIIDKVSNADKLEDVEFMLDEPIINFSQSVVDDSVKANADFQYRSGLKPKIVRTVMGNCCKWCRNIAGTYDYYEVSDTGNNVFRRHAYCRCTVTYVPGTGYKQNVHTKNWTKNDVEQKNYRKAYELEAQSKIRR